MINSDGNGKLVGNWGGSLRGVSTVGAHSGIVSSGVARNGGFNVGSGDAVVVGRDTGLMRGAGYGALVGVGDTCDGVEPHALTLIKRITHRLSSSKLSFMV